MEMLALLGIGLLIAVLVVPWIAIARAGEAQRAFAELEGEFRGMAKRLNEALAQIAALSQTIKNLPSRDRVSDPSTSEPSSTAPVAPAAPTHIAAAAKSAGVEPLRLPARSPNLNAFAERFVRSIKESCLDQLIFFGESSLLRATSEFVLHYHRERNHQGLENKIIRPDFTEFPTHGTINCRKRLGGLLRYYYRKAA